MSQTNQQPVLLAVSAPPFWHCGRTVKKANYAMLLALAPASFMAVWHWGIPAARVMALAMVTGIATEALCQKIMGQDISVDDFSGAVSCLLFAFLLPANAPWWLVMLGGSAGDWPRQDGLRRVGSQRCQHRARRLGHVVSHGPRSWTRTPCSSTPASSIRWCGSNISEPERSATST